MGGRLWVKAGRERESVLFSVAFGLQRHPAPSPTPADAAAMRGLPVLVVDDQPVHRHMLEETLARWGMRSVAVESSAAALTALERAAQARTPFKLVLLDATMPEMDGFELAARIRRAPACPAAPLMILALAGRRGDAARCRALGVAAYLTRPVTRADLFDAILTVLGMPADRPTPFLVTRHSLRESARPLRILLLDASPRDQALMVRVLEEEGHTVLIARTREEALAVFEQQPIDVLCAEPRWSGLGLERLMALARDRTHGEPPACIAIAPRWSPGARRRAQQAGVQACLGRPLRAAPLRRVIQAVRTAAEPPARPPRADVPSRRS
jgi:CheY-like chemotaxis protein